MEKFLVEFNEYEPKYIQIANNIKKIKVKVAPIEDKIVLSFKPIVILLFSIEPP